MTTEAFHKKCDNKGPTLVLIKNDKGHIFSGYSSASWENSTTWDYKHAQGSFIFTLTNMYSISPTKFYLKNEEDGKAICCSNKCGSIFGSGSFGWSNDILVNFSSERSGFPCTYNDTTGKGSSIFSSDQSSGNFTLSEIEVYSVTFSVKNSGKRLLKKKKSRRRLLLQ